MKVVQLHEETPKQWRPKQFLYIEPKNSPLGPQKVKNYTKIKSNIKYQISELTETYKMKVVQLHEQTSKQLSNSAPTPKPAH